MQLIIDTISPISKIVLCKNEKIILSKVIISKNNDQISDLIIKKLSNIFISKYNFKDIESIYVFKGPGSFTSLRIGLSTALGIKFATNIPLYGISLFEMLLSYSITNYSYKNIYILIQSLNNQNFLVIYNHKGEILKKPEKLSNIYNNELLNKIKKNSLLISNEKIIKKNLEVNNKFYFTKQVIILKILISNFKNYSKESKILYPIYFSKYDS